MARYQLNRYTGTTLQERRRRRESMVLDKYNDDGGEGSPQDVGRRRFNGGSRGQGRGCRAAPLVGLLCDVRVMVFSVPHVVSLHDQIGSGRHPSQALFQSAGRRLAYGLARARVRPEVQHRHLAARWRGAVLAIGAGGSLRGWQQQADESRARVNASVARRGGHWRVVLGLRACRGWRNGVSGLALASGHVDQPGRWSCIRETLAGDRRGTHDPAWPALWRRVLSGPLQRRARIGAPQLSVALGSCTPAACRGTHDETLRASIQAAGPGPAIAAPVLNWLCRGAC